MPSREQLNRRARVAGLDPATIQNDSVLEQRVNWLEANADTVTGGVGTGTLTSDATNVTDGDTVTVGNIVYTITDDLAGKKATATLTSDATAPADGDTVVVGGTTYTFKDTLSSGPAVANEVLVGASAATALDNLKSAVNGTAGAGTTYGTGTVANTSATATTNTDTTQLFEAISGGAAGNSIAKSETSAHLDWDGVGATFTGGADATASSSTAAQVKRGADAATTLANLKKAINDSGTQGTHYGYGTQVNPEVTAGAITATTLVVSTRSAQNAVVATTEASTHLSWGGAVTAGGSPAVVASQTRDNAAEPEGRPIS